MNRIAAWRLVSLLLAPLAALHAADIPTSVNPFTLAERNGRRCLLTPEGKPFMMLGISHVGGALGRNAGEDRNARLAQIEGELRSWCFNTAPSPEFWDRFPFIVPIDRMVGRGGLPENDPASRFEDVFDPAFKARLRKQVATLCAKTRDNPNCIGYWWSDIPPWPLEGAKKKYGKHWVDVIRDLPDTAPGKKRYMEFMTASGPHDDRAFLRLIARELYSESAAAFKEHDPQRLIFGERYNGFNTPTEVLEEAARVVDVISVQPYEGTFGAEKFDALHKLTGKPILISDWNVSFKTEAHPVTMWPQFPTQAVAAEAYEKYLRDAFAKPYILGYFKCQYVDQVLPTGMLKQGLHQADGKPYEEFAGLLTRIHQRLIEQLEKEGRLALAAALTPAADTNRTEAATYKLASGPYAVETVNEIVLHDTKRDKDLPVFVSYPKGDGKFPVIIFSHGAMGSGDMDFPIVRHWTSHGYVVLCPTHADSIKLRRAQGRDGAGDTLTLIRGSGRGAWDDNWTQRPRDVSFVLDSLDVLEEKVPGLKGKLDRDRMAVGGHSLGAYTAQVVGGATVTMPGKDQPQSLADPRLKAILQLSGQGTDQQGLHKDSWKDICIPMMCVTGSLDRAAQGQEPLWRREPFALSAPGDKYFLFIEGAHHGSFTGKVAEGGLSGVERLGQLTPEQRSRLRARLAGGQPSAEDATKPADPSAASAGTPAPRPAGRLGGRLAGADAVPGDQKAIFDWVRQATTAFWDAYLKNDAQAKKLLESDDLAKLSDGKAKLERR